MDKTKKGNNLKADKFNKVHRERNKGKDKVMGTGRHQRPAHGKPAFSKAKDVLKKERAKKFQERQALREEKQKEMEKERAKAKQEKEEKIRQYKKKRLEKTKAISKRTKRGQPLMKDRMQLLLKQIEEIKRNG